MTFHDDDLSNARSLSEPVPFKLTSALQPKKASKSFYATTIKPVLDFAMAILAAPILVSLVVVSAVLIARDGHNPFYAQMRIGKGGRAFKMYKLRTMVPNAQELLEAHLTANPDARIEWERTQKLSNDPRITKIGAVLRRTSIDEIPQFLNVVLGSMSIVGPRPYMVEQSDLYPGTRYQEVKPGITGLWQISSRSESEFIARARFDDAYVRTLSFSGDVRIIARTFIAVLRQTGI